ncbi:hypothetical protein CVT26_003384 [Gymnopilus dilepis]|uniref:RRM domain-containing protein n=1 Tax=Gymnopilus dilepis TaxID=231916 RepID=A0A409VQN4_9AGAR|nr:hypothetical protein CVT26_003384 [Gymnopilus dilepis]
MPRDKDTGARRGFAFLMYEDQRSTVLAVDNLNGAKVLDKTLRVDHVKNYKQPKVRNEEGELVDPEEQSLNAKPQMIDGANDIISALNHYSYVLLTDGGAESDSSASSGASIDPEDPMREYLIAQRKEAKALKKAKKSKDKGKHKDETPEERKARKARKKEKKAIKAKSAGVKGVEELLNSLARREPDVPRSEDRDDRRRHRSPVPHRKSRSRSPRHHSSHRSHQSLYENTISPRRSRYLDADAERERTPPRHLSPRHLDERAGHNRAPKYSRYSDDDDEHSHDLHSRGRRSKD